jgi:hypothetical protein
MTEEFVTLTSDEYERRMIKRSTLYLELLEKHNIALQKEIILASREIEINKKKYKLFQQTKEIEEKQLIKFDPQLDDDVKKIYEKINSLEPSEYSKLVNDITILKNECRNLIEQIDLFNKNMPMNVEITYSYD